MTAHTIILGPGSDQPAVHVEATEPTPGLVVYGIPDWVEPTSPYRWRIGHHSGAVIAAASDERKAHAGVAVLADVTDWTADMATSRAAVTPRRLRAMWADLRKVGCYHAGTHLAAAGQATP